MTTPMRTGRPYLIPVLMMSVMLFALAANGQAKPASKNKPASKDKAAAQVQPAPKPPLPRYKDASLPIEDRVADLLARMTLEEKIDQIATGWESRIEVVD